MLGSLSSRTRIIYIFSYKKLFPINFSYKFPINNFIIVKAIGKGPYIVNIRVFVLVE